MAFSHEMGLKLGQLLVGHSLKLCSILVPAFLVDRINLGLKVLWVGWMVSLTLYWHSCLATGDGLFRFHIPNAKSQLRSPPLILGHLPYPQSLSTPGDAHYVLIPFSCRFPFILMAICPSLLSFPTLDPESPIHLPFPLPFLVPSLHLPLITILLPFLNKIQAS